MNWRNCELNMANAIVVKYDHIFVSPVTENILSSRDYLKQFHIKNK